MAEQNFYFRKDFNYHKDVYLYRQLKVGAYRYRFHLLTITSIRIVLILCIWSLVISKFMGSAVVTAATISALIIYALIEVAAMLLRLRSAKHAIIDLHRSIGEKEW